MNSPFATVKSFMGPSFKSRKERFEPVSGLLPGLSQFRFKSRKERFEHYFSEKIFDALSSFKSRKERFEPEARYCKYRQRYCFKSRKERFELPTREGVVR